MRLYRVVPDFIIQWGIPASPELYRQWGDNKIADDPVKVTNRQMTVSFATSGPNARGSQMFVNLQNNEALDSQGVASSLSHSPFLPICHIHSSYRKPLSLSAHSSPYVTHVFFLYITRKVSLLSERSSTASTRSRASLVDTLGNPSSRIRVSPRSAATHTLRQNGQSSRTSSLPLSSAEACVDVCG